MIKTIETLKGDWLTMKPVKVVFAAAVVAAVGFARAEATTESRTAGAVVRFGAVTDLHCADLDTADHTKFVPVAGKVYYRESLGKLEKAVAALNARAVDFVIELGDFKDLTKDGADYTGNPTANWNWYEAKVPDVSSFAFRVLESVLAG